jgi:hypothetical protein
MQSLMLRNVANGGFLFIDPSDSRDSPRRVNYRVAFVG